MAIHEDEHIEPILRAGTIIEKYKNGDLPEDFKIPMDNYIQIFEIVQYMTKKYMDLFLECVDVEEYIKQDKERKGKEH